ncbi:MAG: precorrin-8X methylmutase [Alphaproteobacteria bacterium]|jgi:precorrin isomerase|nr:precorrin-8X methylmutase [Rhodospirillaceae bacterium]MDP6407342.1 precorrin-8X methylmutase [Alphaproteobacteria bacterium]MDP6624781.1 precorrin-8X methylmutase [Alphaproteobacteria bacterium]|tara:strand:- start:544 stop:1164 length:621 start_codon:yes stop_codon:yes gene_type:complete
MTGDYIRDPAEIYRRSFAQVRAEAELDGLPAELVPAAVRIVHACGMPEVVADLAYAPEVADAASSALAAGAPVIVDCRMLASGLIKERLTANEVICTLNEPEVPGLAEAGQTTRSAAAVELWRPHLEGAVVAIGNAPTALFRLLEVLADGAPKPAAILGFPVGFVGARESKQALAEGDHNVPFLTLLGRRGGSAMAAAAVNALAGD